MQRTVYECDKCDDEVHSRHHLHTVTIGNSNSYAADIRIDLCDECRERLIEWTKVN